MENGFLSHHVQIIHLSHKLQLLDGPQEEQLDKPQKEQPLDQLHDDQQEEQPHNAPQEEQPHDAPQKEQQLGKLQHNMDHPPANTPVVHLDPAPQNILVNPALVVYQDHAFQRVLVVDVSEFLQNVKIVIAN